MSGEPTNPTTTDTSIDYDIASETQRATTFDAPSATGHDYYAERDVDGDGVTDHIITHDDGVTKTHHLNSEGRVDSIEADLNNDGVAESIATVEDIDTVRLNQDTDLDGVTDRVSFINRDTAEVIEQVDLDTEGYAREVLIDTDGDGQIDLTLKDTDGDRHIDTVSVDTDGDGHINVTYVDSDNDGTIDEAFIDKDNTDGVLETHITADDLPGGDLGTVDDFIAHAPFGGLGDDPTPQEADYGTGVDYTTGVDNVDQMSMADDDYSTT